MHLTKTIPMRKKTVHFAWLRKGWMLYGDFKKHRERAKMSNPFEKCYWCSRKFGDDEALNLASTVKAGRNRVLCDVCAGFLEESDE